ncbi:MAG: DUF6657 family protein [Spirochaeta sp.]
MSRIKSALELALERTENVQGDSRKLLEHERKQDGKRLLAKFYEILQEGGIPESDWPQGLFGKPKDGIDAARMQLSRKIQAFPKEEQKWVREGLKEVLLAGIVLPSEDNYRVFLEPARQAARALSSSPDIDTLFSQASQIFDQYLQEKQQLIDNLKQQFAPRIRQKEDAYAKQTGQRITINPETDPEFQQYLQQGMEQLRGYYIQAVQQLRVQLAELI